MRVDEAHAPKASLCRTKAANVRKHQPRRVADDDRIQLAGSMHEDADLSSRFKGDRRERAREFGRDDVVDRDSPAIEALERAQNRRS
jgi:hypothetical protein